MLFCDGSVHTVAYSTDPQVHAQLSNRRDGVAISAKSIPD
jgi:hypothetical protein